MKSREVRNSTKIPPKSYFTLLRIKKEPNEFRGFRVRLCFKRHYGLLKVGKKASSEIWEK